MSEMREELDRKLRHRQPRDPRVDHPRRSAGETHLPGCPVYAANVTACPAECNCWPWTDGQAEQPPPAHLTLGEADPHHDGCRCSFCWGEGW